MTDPRAAAHTFDFGAQEMASGPESVRRDTRLLLVSNDAMRARRRPAALLAYYIYQLGASVRIAWPISRALAGIFDGHPRGTSVVFDEGGWAIFALARDYERTAPAIWGLVTLVTVLGAIGGLIPLSALLASISHATPEMRAPRPRHLAPYVVTTFGPLLYLLALGSAIELTLLGVSAWTFSAVSGAAEPRWGEARADQIAALACAALLILLAIAAVMHDLARAAVVRFRIGTWRAIQSAWLTFRRAPFRLLWSWIWRGSISLALVPLVAVVVGHLGFRGLLSLFAIGLLHQLVVLSRVSLRSSWLARALRGVDASAAAGSRRAD